MKEGLTKRQLQLWMLSVTLRNMRDALLYIPQGQTPGRDEIRLFFRLESLIRQIEARLHREMVLR